MAAVHSSQYLALARTFAAAFSALGDFARRSPTEAAQIWASIAAHVRSAEPMALTAAQQTPAVFSVKVPIGDGFYELTAVDGVVQLYVMDAEGHDVALGLAVQQASAMRRDLAGVEVAAEGQR